MTPAQYRKQLSPCQRRYHEPYSEKLAMSLLELYILASCSQKNKEFIAKSSHHIFIPVKYDLRAGKPFKKTFPLRILLSSDEDIFMLNYQKSEVAKLNPSAIIIDYQRLRKKKNCRELMNLLYSLQTLAFPMQITLRDMSIDLKEESIIRSLNIPLIMPETVCNNPDKSAHNSEDIYTMRSALADITKDPQRCIELSGHSRALYTPQGLMTPFYYLYSIFSRIDGNITEQRDQYMIIKSEETVYLLISQEDRDSKLKSHIHINEIYGKFFVAEKMYTKNHTCYEILKALGHPEF